MKNKPNNPQVKFTAQFNKMRKKAPIEIKEALLGALELFLEDPSNSHLKNHSLKEEYSGYNSINVTEDWRALFKVKVGRTQITYTFHILGTHKQLYG